MDKKEKHNNDDKEIKLDNDNKTEETEDSLEDKLKNSEEKLLRSLAEIENQRRRFEKETTEALEYGGFSFAKEMLSLLDNLNRAKESVKNNEILKDNKDLNKFLEYFDILEKDLISTFEKNKIKKIDCINKKFDPNFHQAMSEVEDDKADPGTILQEIQAGYLLGERLLRPALVSVSKKKSSKDLENKDKKEKK